MIMLATLLAFLIALGLVRLAASEMLAHLVLDIPNDRSLHTMPVPRTGGVGLMLAAVATVLVMGGGPAALVVAMAVLAAVFVVDDVSGLPVPVRFGVQLAIGLVFLAWTGPYTLWLWPLLAIGLVWSANLYNFMDGSNGLAGGMAVIGFGAYALAAGSHGSMDLALVAAAVAGAAAGFLVWNFGSARIFLGDAGSIPLGFAAAALGVVGWQRGVWPFWFPALVFSTFIVDSGLTLAKRLIHRENPFQAHRSHYYQRLIRMGWSHRRLALWAYALMAATAVSALLFRQSSALLSFVMLVVWAAIIGGLAVRVDRAWRASPARGR